MNSLYDISWQGFHYGREAGAAIKRLRPRICSIDKRILRIRRKIEIDAKDPQIIKTVHGAGYLFAADVEWQEPTKH